MLEDKFVKCLACGKEHQTTPDPREHTNHEGMLVTGVAVSDYTYVIDMYMGNGPAPICKEHTRDELSIVKEKDLYTSV